MALLVAAVLGIAPWVLGTDPDCPEQGPHGVFLLAWLASVGAATGAIVCLSTTQGAKLTRGVGIAIASLVPIGAVIWFVIVVADGTQECGF